MDDLSILSQKINGWYALNKREMPWRGTTDPYTIWLSEIILQQTQVVQGTPYFEKFIAAFPNLKSLAEASEDQVLKLWQGLGYYSRARNLHHTARYIYYELGGHFPKTYTDLLKLKGVGEYTAAAIASIAYNEPVAVVDGNVVRVISRLFKINHPFNTAQGKQSIKTIANKIIDPTNPGQHNQAMMELGSLICKPQNPLCGDCPVFEHCLSAKDNTMNDYPLKVKKGIVKVRHFNFFVPIIAGNRTLVTKRTTNDIWKNMFTFPMHESNDEAMFLDNFIKDFGYDEMQLIKIIDMKHILTHRLIQARFYLFHIKEDVKIKKNNIFDVEFKTLEFNYALPRIITRFLENREVSILFD